MEFLMVLDSDPRPVGLTRWEHVQYGTMEPWKSEKGIPGQLPDVDPYHFKVSVPLARHSVWDWAVAAMEDRPRLVSGVIAQSDRMTVQREWAFKNATIRSVAFPEMDFRFAPASIDVAVRTQERLCLKSGQSFRIRPTSIAPVAWWGQARLSISPKPYHPARPLCVCQISSFAFNNHVLKGVGDPEVQRGEIPNLCFTIPDQYYDASWEGLYKDTIKGKAGISGSLEFMSKDGASTIATMDFWDAGISAVRPTKQLRGPVRVTEVQMFIERIRFR